jgi:CHAT domain-containing protein
MKKFLILLLIWGFSSLDTFAQEIAKMQVEFDSLYKNNLYTAHLVGVGKQIIEKSPLKTQKDSIAWGKLCNKIGTIYYNLGTADTAKLFLQKTIFTLNQSNPSHIEAINYLGRFYLDESNFEIADSFLLQSLDLQLKYFGKNNDTYFKYLYTIGQSKGWQDKYREAEVIYESGIKDWYGFNRVENNQICDFFARLGFIKLYFGQISQSEKILRKSVTIGEKSPDGRLPYSPYFQLSQFLLNQGKVEEALEYMDKLAVDLELYHEDKIMKYAHIMHMKGDMYAELLQYDDAIEYYKKYQTNPQTKRYSRESTTIDVNIKLANMMIEKGDFILGEQLLMSVKDSIALFEYEKTINNSFLNESLGKYYAKIGNHSAAITHFDNAISIYDELFGKSDSLNMSRMTSKIGIANSLLKTGNIKKCNTELQFVMAILEQNKVNDNATRNAYLFDAIAQINNKKPKEALATLTKHHELLTNSINNDLFLLTDHQRLQRVSENLETSNLLLSFLAKDGKNQDKLAELSLNFQLFSKSLLLSAAQNIRQNIQSDPKLAPIFTNYTEIRERLAWCYTQPKSELETQKINISQLEFQADSLEKIIARQSTTFAANNLNKSFNWTGVRDRLHTGEAALEIVRYHEVNIETTDSIRYAIFVITPEMRTKPEVVFLPQGERIEEVLTEKYLTECANREGKGNTQSIYGQLWKPLEPFLKNITRVYVSADGAFHKINLGALKKTDGSFLADNIEIKPVFSLKDFSTVDGGRTTADGGRTTADGGISVLVGNPMFSLSAGIAGVSRSVVDSDSVCNVSVLDAMPIMLRNLDESRGLSLNPLPGSQKEVEEINALLQKNGLKTTLLTQENATETALKAIKKPKIMHLATHGYFLANSRNGTAGLSRGVVERNPMLRSMLFFAGAQATLDKKNNQNSEGDDGILTAYEAQNMDLEGTELVVLSACQTAQGKLQNGEGVYGLQRALRIAGAQNIILSLWDVDDAVGSIFMKTFYEKWLGGMSKSDAFRFAQLEVKKSNPQPFYWAGFVLVGE